MSTWVIISWVLVAALTGVNIFVFLKLKGSAEQMLKMAFPGAKDMNEAMEKMQQMMGGMQALQGGGGKPHPMAASFGKAGASLSGNSGLRPAANTGMDAQLKAAMDMLQKTKK